MKELSSILAIVGLGLGGIYFLTTESDKKVLGAETFMASTGARSVRKDTMYYPLIENGRPVMGKAQPNIPFQDQIKYAQSDWKDTDFWEPVVKKIVQKLKRKGQIPNFTAHPGHPSYEEWLLDGGHHFNKNHRYFPIWASWIHPPIMNQYNRGFILTPYDNNCMLPEREGQKHYNERIIGNREKKGGPYYDSYKWPSFNWKYAAKQRAQFPIDAAKGVYGQGYANQPMLTAFDNLKWYHPLNLQRWMELNPTIKAISYKHAKYGWKDFKFWKTLPANWPMMPDGTPRTQMSHRKTQWYLLPDKKMLDKQAKEALDYFVILWENGLNAKMLETYTNEVQAIVKKEMEEAAFWANLQATGKLKSHILEKIEEGSIYPIPSAYHTVAQEAWNEYEKNETTKHQDRMKTIRSQWDF